VRKLDPPGDAGANPVVSPSHDRAWRGGGPTPRPDAADPAPSANDLWLDPEVKDVNQLQPLPVPYPAEDMEACPVPMLVSSPANDEEQCIRPAG
jgi:hypothetical protein